MSADTMRQRLDEIQHDALGEEHAVAQRIAAAATRLSAEMKPPSPPNADHPLDSGEITEDWIDQTIDMEAARERLDKRRGVLLTLANAARNQATGLYTDAHSRILAAYQAELKELLAEVGELSDELGDVDTASKAIANDRGPQWKRLTELADEYDELRAAQQSRMSIDVVFNATPNHHAEPHASDLFLRNLDDVWPLWRHAGHDDRVMTLDPNRQEPRREPWPADRCELLLWLDRSDAQAWIPTEHQLERLRRDRSARANPMPSNVIPGRPDKPSKLNKITVGGN
jgi:hypothetical protein